MYGSPPRFDKGSRNPRSLTFNAARQTATFWAMAQPIRSRRRYARQPQAAVKGFSRAPRSVTPIHFSSQGARQRYTFQSFQRRPGMLCNFIIPPGWQFRKLRKSLERRLQVLPNWRLSPSYGNYLEGCALGDRHSQPWTVLHSVRDRARDFSTAGSRSAFLHRLPFTS